MAEQTSILTIRIDNNQAIKRVVELTNSIERNTARVKDLKKAIKELDTETENYDEQVQAMKEEIAATNAETTAYKSTLRDVQKTVVNGIKSTQEQEGSLKSLRATVAKLTEEYDSLSKEQRLSNEGMQKREEIRALNDELKELEGNTGRFQRNVGDYEGAIKRAIAGTSGWGSAMLGLSQNMKEAGGVMAMLKAQISSIGALVKSMPQLLAIFGVAKVVGGIKDFVNYSTGLAEATRMTEQLTQLQDTQLLSLRDNISALADVYDKDYRDVLQSVNALAQQFGISYAESFDILKDGFVAGADATGQYLDVVKEYPAFFREAGLSAEEFIAVSTEALNSGVYSDKGIDAIKEATIRLREMNTATREALEGIGISADELQAAMEEGTTTAFEAIQLVSAKLGEYPELSEEVGRAVADIFGGAGEDAGLQYLLTLQEIETELDVVKGKAGESAKTQEKHLESQILLTSTLNTVFGENIKSLGDIITGAKTAFNYLTSYLIIGFVAMYGYAAASFNAIIALVRETGRAVGEFGDLLLSLFSFDGSKISNAYNDLKSQLSAIGTSTGDAFGQTVDKYVDGTIERLNATRMAAEEDVQKQNQNATLPKATTTSLKHANTSSGKSASAGSGRYAQELEREREKALADLERYEQQLLDVIIENTLTQKQQLAIRTRDEAEALKKGYLENIKTAEDKEALTKLHLDAMKALGDRYAAEMAEIDRRASEEEIQRKSEEYAKMSQQEALQHATRVMQLKMEKASEREILIAEAEGVNAEMLRLRQEDFESEAAFEHARTQLKLEESEIRKQIEENEKAHVKEVVDATYSMFQAIGDLIEATAETEEEATRRGKVLALAEIAFSQGIALAEGISSAMALPIPYNFIALAANIAAVVANIATAIATVNSAKFATGGLVEGAGSGTSDSIPAMLSNGESVLTARATSMFAPVLSAFNQMGGGVPIGGVAGGEEMLARAFARGAASLPAPEVAVVEITSAQKRIQLIESITRMS